MNARVEATIDLPTDPEAAFAVLVDLSSQEKWIIATKLYPIGGDVSPPQVGARMAAFTALGSVGFLDTMVVTEFDPPHRWVTQHEGGFVQGVGVFSVEPTPSGCRFTWTEELNLPFGLVGRLGWLLAKPVVRMGLSGSVRRLARKLASGSLPLPQRGSAPR